MQNAPWYPEVSSLTNECEAKRRNAREPLDAYVRSLNVPIQWEAVSRVSETSIMASHWIGTFKGPNVCAQRFSRVSPHARWKDLTCASRGSLTFRLFASRSCVSEKTSGFQCRQNVAVQLWMISCTVYMLHRILLCLSTDFNCPLLVSLLIMALSPFNDISQISHPCGPLYV